MYRGLSQVAGSDHGHEKAPQKRMSLQAMPPCNGKEGYHNSARCYARHTGSNCAACVHRHAQRPGWLVVASRFAAWSVQLRLHALDILLVILPGVGRILAVAGGDEVAVIRRAARPRRRLPQLRPHEGFGTVIEGGVDSDH